MPGRDVITTEQLRAGIELIKLHMPIAFDARIRRSPRPICRCKRIYDTRGKIVREVEYIVRHSEVIRHPPGVLHIVKGTARVSGGNSGILVPVQLHGAANALVSCVTEQFCRNRGIHTARHCHKNPFAVRQIFDTHADQSAKSGVDR